MDQRPHGLAGDRSACQRGHQHAADCDLLQGCRDPTTNLHNSNLARTVALYRVSLTTSNANTQSSLAHILQLCMDRYVINGLKCGLQ